MLSRISFNNIHNRTMNHVVNANNETSTPKRIIKQILSNALASTTATAATAQNFVELMGRTVITPVVWVGVGISHRISPGSGERLHRNFNEQTWYETAKRVITFAAAIFTSLAGTFGCSSFNARIQEQKLHTFTPTPPKAEKPPVNPNKTPTPTEPEPTPQSEPEPTPQSEPEPTPQSEPEPTPQGEPKERALDESSTSPNGDAEKANQGDSQHAPGETSVPVQAAQTPTTNLAEATPSSENKTSEAERENVLSDGSEGAESNAFNEDELNVPVEITPPSEYSVTEGNQIKRKLLPVPKGSSGKIGLGAVEDFSPVKNLLNAHKKVPGSPDPFAPSLESPLKPEDLANPHSEKSKAARDIFAVGKGGTQ